MAKLTLENVATGYNLLATINSNNDLIEAAIENTVSRDGTTPNTLTAAMDANSNKLTNLADGTNNQDAVTLAQLTAASVVSTSTTAAAVSLADALGDYTATTAEAAFAELASTAGAAIVGVLDTAGDFTGVTVETVLTELQANIDALAFLTDVVDDTSPTLGGGLNCNGNDINMNKAAILSQPVIQGYGVRVNAPSSSAGTLVLDHALANTFTTTLTEDVTTVTLSNPIGVVATTNTLSTMLIKFVQDGTGGWAVTWPAAVKWQGGTAPVITTAAGSVDLVTLKTWDAGTTWYGDFGQAYS